MTRWMARVRHIEPSPPASGVPDGPSPHRPPSDPRNAVKSTPRSNVKVYISGPISGLSQEEYTDRFGKAEALLMDLGLEPVSPLKVLACETEDCADADSVKEDGTYLHTWNCYLKYDLIAMLECDAILMLGGWEKSKGAQLERDVALRVGMTVIPYTELDKD